MSARRPAPARLALAGLLALPAVVATSTPAAAATSVTLTSKDVCGVHLEVGGLAAGRHVAEFEVVSLATGKPVPVLPEDDEEAGGAPAVRTPVLTAVRSFTVGQDVFVRFDPRAVPDDDVRVRVAVRVDRKTLLHVELSVPACGAEQTPTSPTTSTTRPEPAAGAGAATPSPRRHRSPPRRPRPRPTPTTPRTTTRTRTTRTTRTSRRRAGRTARRRPGPPSRPRRCREAARRGRRQPRRPVRTPLRPAAPDRPVTQGRLRRSPDPPPRLPPRAHRP